MTFTKRSCPFCEATSDQELFSLSVSDICEHNWTYSTEYVSILQLDPQDRFPVCRCLSCGFVYAGLLPSDDFLALIYNRVINLDRAEKASCASCDYARRLRYITQLIQLIDRQSGRVLDFGAGFGMSAKILQLIGVDVLAYDASDSRQSHLLAAGLQVRHNWSEVCTSGPYDVVICDNVLEHLADVRQQVQMLTEVMDKGAIVYVSVPSYEESHIVELQKNYAAGTLSDMSLNPWEHLNYFDLSHLDGMLAEFGLRPVKSCEISVPVDIGLRAESSFSARFRNGLASMQRLLGYLVRGTVLESVNNRFYRFQGRA